MKVNESRYISLFVVSGSIKKLLSIGRVDTYFSRSIVSYLFLNIFSIDLKLWGYSILLLS